MPRPPRCAPEVEAIPGAVYAPVSRPDGPAVGAATPLNVGDTWLEPFEGARMQDVRQADHPGHLGGVSGKDHGLGLGGCQGGIVGIHSRIRLPDGDVVLPDNGLQSRDEVRVHDALS